MKRILAISVILLFIGSLSTSTGFHFEKEVMKTTQSNNAIDMIIFLSPQYTNDENIDQAIKKYIESVKSDLGWNTTIIALMSEMNDFRKIDKIIERYYENYSIKACIMVGEDTDTALSCDIDNIEVISTVPWSTIGGESAYEIGENGVVWKAYKMDICISCLYPSHHLSYRRKVNQITKVFNKFSVNRGIYYQGDLLVFCDSEYHPISREMLKELEEYGNLDYREDPSNIEILQSLTKSYSLYSVFGHSNPSKTDVNADLGGIFYANFVPLIDTPVLMAGGCYVGGWWSNKEDNNKLDPSIIRPWYGSKIFTSPFCQVMILGFPTQSGYSYPISFVENALPNLTKGMTLAESMIGHFYGGDDQHVFGDPTFHFSFFVDIIKPKENHLYLANREIININGRAVICGPITIETVVHSNVTRVSFYINEHLVYNDSEFPFEYTLRQVKFGRSTIKVYAYDTENNGGCDTVTFWKIF